MQIPGKYRRVAACSSRFAAGWNRITGWASAFYSTELVKEKFFVNVFLVNVFLFTGIMFTKEQEVFWLNH
jgi:hypothetical protein